MKRKSCFFFLFLLISIPFVIVEATNYDDSKLKQIASNINYDMSYVEVNHQVTFTIRFTNVYQDVYLYDVEKDKRYDGTNHGEIILSGYQPGKSYRFEVRNQKEGQDKTIVLPTWDGTKYYDKVITIPGEEIPMTPISTIYISTPSYNPYYSDPVCDGFDQIKLCQRWEPHSLSYEEFIKSVEKEKAKIKAKNLKPLKDVEETFWDRIKPYILLIIATPIFLVAIIIIIVKNVKEYNTTFEGWQK